MNSSKEVSVPYQSITKSGYKQFEYRLDNEELHVLGDYADTFDIPVFFSISNISGEGQATCSLKALRIWGAVYPEYFPVLTEEEMWGKHIRNDYGTKEPGFHPDRSINRTNRK